uniref:Uncharacterized protein n=1 Tax=Aquisalinus luteolus TaxID=1566827 RepID=A0A8J3A903_9PROT|nr:hypothetical protein GCM10011355_29150 [Aquisalinus luteolus]
MDSLMRLAVIPAVRPDANALWLRFRACGNENERSGGGEGENSKNHIQSTPSGTRLDIRA